MIGRICLASTLVVVAMLGNLGGSTARATTTTITTTTTTSTAATTSAATTTVPRPGQYYLALGDSETFGFQGARIAAEAKATGTVNPAHFTTGFAFDLQRILQALRPGIQLVNYGCPGATSTDIVSTNGCPSYPFPLHNSFSGAQLSAALAFIAAHPGQVSPITVNIGANDVLQLVTKCGGLQNPSCIASGFPATLTTFSSNLAVILGSLRKAAPNADIIVLKNYNPFSAAAPASSTLAEAFNKAITAVAAATGVRVADAYTPFNLTGAQPQTICALTLICTAAQDVHPSDAGYLVEAQAFYDASGFAAGAPGFLVSWSSSAPGQGEVYFGPGPGCTGLVEVATQDLFTNSTQHSVLVTGNDLAGTVGDAGITPGATYSYELVTFTPSGVQIDNNGGKCYRVTVGNS